jgi:RNA polymerase sigma-32 factor
MILRFLLDNFALVSLGRSRAGRKLFFQLKKERDQLLREGLQASPKLLAERLGVSEKEVHAVDQHMRAPALSLHAPTGDEGGRALAEVVPEDVPNNPEETAAKAELGAMVAAELASFAADQIVDDRERTIWTQRLVATDQKSLAALGKQFGVSKERIRQIEARIKKRLKAHLEARLGDEIDFEFSVPDA